MDLDKAVTVLVAVVSLLLGVYNAWSIQNPPDSSDLVSQGNLYFADGDYKKAIGFYEKALKYHGTYSNALKYKGYALFNLAMDDPAQRIKISSRLPQDSPAMAARALLEKENQTQIILDEGRLSYMESSYQYLQDAARANPSDVEALLYSGIVSLVLFQQSPSYDPMRDFDRTLRAVEDLSYKKSAHIRAIKGAAWYGKGVAYLKNGDGEEAMTCFRNSRVVSEEQV
ncbi:MAG: Tetratricopeptide repeat protein [Methanosaeta sp. PtaB.Bin039]|nr:MAG: Tetratricopeptide repeat protein [Methanosaeta sp. PtaB.Bin039]OPY45076.1 MAG: Tetratricopeptide repeat protein [Methanosaeta sp. PtaU1.Bin028]HOT06677.1 tetratricopeptide repeat protein [Methanotrichaceae archaeon]HQF16705.1 tetratricopeptide repeat protein [Methanotrichaceae archaeon]HQI91283.1 tetratricopeptide repeat protein [Methanotrichaceae archaeon]